MNHAKFIVACFGICSLNIVLPLHTIFFFLGLSIFVFPVAFDHSDAESFDELESMD